MILRACCLISLGLLESFCLGAFAAEIELDLPVIVDSDRSAGFEVVSDVRERATEDSLIFNPISPITVEAEPVKLPDESEED